MSRYTCHRCKTEHGTENMVAYCAACYSDWSEISSSNAEILELREQLERAKAELEVERKSREDYARLLDDLATAFDASNFAEAIALAKQYAFRLAKAEAALRDGGKR